MNRCLAAYTEPGADYPPYINASETPDGLIRVIVRGPSDTKAKPWPVSPEAAIEIPPAWWFFFLKQAMLGLSDQERREMEMALRMAA